MSIAWIRRREWTCRLGLHAFQPCRVSFVFDPDTYYSMRRCETCAALRARAGEGTG